MQNLTASDDKRAAHDVRRAAHGARRARDGASGCKREIALISELKQSASDWRAAAAVAVVAAEIQ